MAEIKLKNIRKTYSTGLENVDAVNGVSMTIQEGEFQVLVGPSGSGKSTILRMIAGLEDITSGIIEFNGHEVNDLSPVDRDVAMVFQNFALYSKMTVKQNIGYGLKHSSNLSKRDRNKKVEDMADKLEINDLLTNYPSQLSGGQKQRVALGRALVRSPEVFLLDEPLANLDAKLRSQFRSEIQKIQKELNITTVYVTHDQKEAITMGDRVAILNNGKLHQNSPPLEEYYKPNDLFVGTFLGSPSMNIMDVELTKDGSDLLCTHNSNVISRITNFDEDVPPTALMGIRPEDISIRDSSHESNLSARVLVSEYQGNVIYLHVEFKDNDFIIKTQEDQSWESDDEIGISIDPNDIYLFEESGDTKTLKAPAQRDGTYLSKNSDWGLTL